MITVYLHLKIVPHKQNHGHFCISNLLQLLVFEMRTGNQNPQKKSMHKRGEHSTQIGLGEHLLIL